MGYWEIFDHGADIGIRGIGSNLEEAFKMAATALFSLMYPNIQKITDKDIKSFQTKEVTFKCSAIDIEYLFVEFLNTLISKSDLLRLVFFDFDITINKVKLTCFAKAKGIPLTEDICLDGLEVKAATYCELKVKKENSHWIAQCVVDV